jgi:hypothetical protein
MKNDSTVKLLVAQGHTAILTDKDKHLIAATIMSTQQTIIDKLAECIANVNKLSEAKEGEDVDPAKAEIFSLTTASLTAFTKAMEIMNTVMQENPL